MAVMAVIYSSQTAGFFCKSAPHKKEICFNDERGGGEGERVGGKERGCVCMCTCVCVCGREREKDRQLSRNVREDRHVADNIAVFLECRKKKKKCVFLCTCVCLCVCV